MRRNIQGLDQAKHPVLATGLTSWLEVQGDVPIAIVTASFHSELLDLNIQSLVFPSPIRYR